MDNKTLHYRKFFDDLSKQVRPATIHMTGAQQMNLVSMFVASITKDARTALEVMVFLGICAKKEPDPQRAAELFVDMLRQVPIEFPQYLKPVIANIIEEMVKLKTEDYIS